jgi:8-oxo-dGTP diphosphatase
VSQAQSASVVQVAVGILSNAAGAVLIARRPANAHQGGLWEFPGGKVEAEESVDVALKRELWEELGIELQSAAPLLRVFHTYPDKTVQLEVWRVQEYQGEPRGRERQPITWVMPMQLYNFAFPAADQPIIACLQEHAQIAQQANSNGISALLRTARQLGSDCSIK